MVLQHSSTRKFPTFTVHINEATLYNALIPSFYLLFQPNYIILQCIVSDRIGTTVD